ncbi:MAG: glycosyltransferase [Microthrixaceae bacterium]|nr:glycosyltransferase [Microthrixaceae bacterium]
MRTLAAMAPQTVSRRGSRVTGDPRVTVVIPCHNSLRRLPETLETVLGQSFGDFEVVLVDDGGDDDLAGWASSLHDDRVRVVRQENAGVAAARNHGIAQARAELVAFLDSDDLWLPHTLASLVERYDEAVADPCAAGEPPVGLVYGWYQIADEEGHPVGRVEARDAEGVVWEQFVVSNPVATGATLVPTVILEQLGGFEVNRDRFPVDVEDWELWIRIAGAGYRVALVRDVLCLYRRHSSNSSVAVDSLDSAYRHLLAKVFDGQPPRRRWLLAPAVARVEMILAWQSLNDPRRSAAGEGLPAFRPTSSSGRCA